MPYQIIDQILPAAFQQANKMDVKEGQIASKMSCFNYIKKSKPEECICKCMCAVNIAVSQDL